jgi:hypothetical protein
VAKHLFLLIGCILFSFFASAQEDGDPLAPTPSKPSLIPLDTIITIKLLTRDTNSLEYYSLYGFEYKKDTKKLYSELMIPRTKDVYRHMATQSVQVKLCRITQFVNSYMGIASPPIDVEDYIEITKENGKDKQHFNFDPSQPYVFLTICEPAAKPVTK